MELNNQDAQKTASILIKRAQVYQSLNQNQKALEDLQTAIKRDPTVQKEAQTIVAQISSSNPQTTTNISSTQDARIETFQHHLTQLDSMESVRPFVKSQDFVAVLTACGTPSTPPRVKSLAFMILTKLFNPSDPSNFPLQFVIEQCAACFSYCLDQGKNDSKLLAYRTLLAIFQTSMTIGAAILCQEGTIEEMMDVIEFEIVPVQIAMTEVLTIASSDKTCRQQMLKYSTEWLVRTAASPKTDTELKAVTNTALAKLRAQPKEQEEDTSGLEEAMDKLHLSNENVVDSLKDLIKAQSTDSSLILNAVEGLAYACLQPQVKENLGSDMQFLKCLSTLAVSTAREETPNSNPLLFGIGTIFANITMYRPVLDEQQKQMNKLRNLANQQQNQQKQPDDPRENDDQVEKRIENAVKNGVSVALMVLAKNKSTNIRGIAAQTYLNIVTPQATRGQLLQQGIVKGLLPLSREKEMTGILASQALAKLAITTDPRIAFQGDLILDMVRPFLTLCQDPKSQLRQFEGLMALTNLASVDDRVRLLIENAKGMDVIENLQLSDNDMVQRAATELVCNMTFCDPVFELYSQSQNRIRLLMILSDHEDAATRRAASGALAILANSPEACELMMKVDKGFERMARWVEKDETPDVQHRGVETLRCLIQNQKKTAVDGLVKEHVDQKLVELVKASQVPVVRQAAMEVLKLFVENGVQIKA